MSLENPKERETSRRARKKGISRLYPLTADKKGNGYSLPPPFTVTGLREVSAKRSSLSPITKMEEIPPVTRRIRLAQERTRKNLLFSFVHDSNTSNQHLHSIKKEETNSRSIFPAFTIFFIINPRFLLRKVKVCSFCVLNLIFNRTTNLNLSNYKNQNLESVHFQIHYQLLSTHGTAGKIFKLPRF